jgi:hypothetical protein
MTLDREFLDAGSIGIKAKSRGPFLTTLCILSFIGCGLSFIGTLYSFYSYYTSLKYLSELNTSVDNPLGEEMFSSVKMILWSGLVSLVSTGVVLWGVIMMWRLRKSGFRIYLVGQLAPIIFSVVIAYIAKDSTSFTGIRHISVIFGLFPALIFIVLYGIAIRRLD